MSSNSQNAHHIAHVGHDAGEVEMNQLTRFQHLEKMVKLIATHVCLRQDSDLICSAAVDGSNPDWSPDNYQYHDNITRVVSEPPPPQKRKNTDHPLCSENDDRVAERDSIFFCPPEMFNVDDSVTEYVSLSRRSRKVLSLRLPC